MNQEEPTPEIDYLSKDYASFRRLMLDHLALTVPGWKEPGEADLGNVLVEVLAYAADYLSYYQDAVATEAYLGTARLRTSVKRHVRLLDYVMQEGCNARTWVQVQVSEALTLPKATQVLTHVPNMVETTTIPPHSPTYNEILQQRPIIFATMHNATLYPEHNEIALYAEEGQELSLPVGGTSALLCDPRQEHERGSGLRLKVGDVLVFEEVKNVLTGLTAGADDTRRHVVRLTRIQRERMGDQPVVRITWAQEDAFPYPLRVAIRQQGDMIPDICVARGNVVLADHGLTIYHEALPPVLSGQRYRPSLRYPGLAFTAPYDHALALTRPACEASRQEIQEALPCISLFQRSRTEPLQVPRNEELASALHQLTLSDAGNQQLRSQGLVLSPRVTIRSVRGAGWELHDTLKNRHWLAEPAEQHVNFVSFTEWTLQRDLLSSSPQACDYAVDMEEDRLARLRFGFEKQGRQPQPGDQFRATYRVGGGEAGNVRADALTHIVTNDTRITALHNPLAAKGGTNPQLLEDVRDNAPYAFRTPQHCVTEEDYTAIAMQHPQVAKAVAHLGWSGSWPAACVYVQRAEGQVVDAAFAAEVARFMQDFRIAGHEIEVRGPYFVGLAIALRISLEHRAIRSVVSKALALAFHAGADGFFRPGKFTFGQHVYQSQVMARAMSVPGVGQVEIQAFHRLDVPTPPCVDAIVIQPLEIARLDNDSAAPHNGIIQFALEGGL